MQPELYAQLDVARQNLTLTAQLLEAKFSTDFLNASNDPITSIIVDFYDAFPNDADVQNAYADLLEYYKLEEMLTGPYIPDEYLPP